MGTEKNYYKELDNASMGVQYTKTVEVDYYDPISRRCTLYSAKRGFLRLMDMIDIPALVSKRDGKVHLQDEARIYRLFRSMNKDNIICVRDKHTHKQVCCSSEKQLMDIVDCSERAWLNFKKLIFKENRIVLKIKATGVVPGAADKNMFVINPLFTMRDRQVPIWLYGLFKEELDPFLTPSYREKLQEELDTFAATAESSSQKDLEYADYEEDEAKSIDEHIAIFMKNVIRGHEYQFTNKKHIHQLWTREQMQLLPAGSINAFFLTQVSDSRSRKRDNIVGFKNICVDIDCAKKSDGSYYKLEEIEERKMRILSAIRPHIPAPTAITWSRNGFHLIWSTTETDIEAEWLCTAQYVKNLFAGLCDPVVTTDKTRLLRCPYTIHKKTGTERYETRLIETNDIIYDYDKLTARFNEVEDAFTKAKNHILAVYPDIKEEDAKSCTANAKSCTMNAAELNEYHQALAALDTSVFDLSDEPAKKMTKDEAKEFLKKELNLAEFLQLPDNRSFDCIFHQTEGGDGNSANIYAPDKEYSHWRYVCHCLDAEDIFGCMYRLSHRSFDDIFAYLCKVANIEIVD